MKWFTKHWISPRRKTGMDIKWMKKTAVIYCRWGGRGNVLWDYVFWVDYQPSSIKGRRWRRKSLGKTERCGDDEEEEEKKERSNTASPCKNVYLCCVSSPVCSVLVYALRVLSLCAALYYLYFSGSLCVYHTWVKLPSQTLPHSLFYPTQVQKNCSLSFGRTQNAPKWN